MEDRIVKKFENLDIYGNIHGELQKVGISHQQLAISNLLASFFELVVDWRANPRKFKKELKNLRHTALKPYLDDPDKYAHDIIMINTACTHLLNYTANNIDPLIEEYQLTTRKRNIQEFEWATKGVASVSKTVLTGSFKHGVPTAMLGIGMTKLARISAILGAAVDTINSYAQDPTGRCAIINKHEHAIQEYKDAMSSTWVKIGWSDAPTEPGARETGFFTSLADRAFCTLPQWTTGTVGNVFSGVSEITGATVSTFAAFIIFLMAIALWLLLNRNSEFGIPWMAYWKFNDPESKAPASTIQYIQQIAPAITSGAVSPPKAVVREVKHVQDAAQKAYVQTIEDTKSSPSTQRIVDATEASIDVFEQQSRRVSPLSQLILQSEIDDKQEELSNISSRPNFLKNVHEHAHTPRRRVSPKRKSPKNVPSFLSEIKSARSLRPAGERILRSPPKKKTPFNTELLNKMDSRRQYLVDESDEDEKDTDWMDFGKRKSRKRSKRRSSRKKSSKRKVRRSKSKRTSKRTSKKSKKKVRRSIKKSNL